MENLARFLRKSIRRLGAMRDRLWFQWFNSWWAFALFVAGFIALFSDLVGPFTAVPALGWLAALSDNYGMTLLQFALAIVAVWTGFQLVSRAMRRQKVATLELREIDASGDMRVKGVRGRDDPFALVKGRNGVIALNGAVDSRLDKASNPITRSPKPYVVPDNLKPWAPLATPHVGPLTVNEAKIGLRTEIDAAAVRESRPLMVQDSDYLRDRCTNGVIVKQVWDLERDESAWNGRSCFIDANDRLLPLETGFASNQLGGSTLLIDQSWNIHLTRQTSDSAESAGLLAPTGSGSFDLRRLRRAMSRDRRIDFQTFARSEIERELREETGLNLQPDEIQTILIGFGRYLYRGGKPEVFAVTAIRRPSVVMRVTADEETWTAEHKTLAWKDLERGDDAIAAEMSAPLAANLHLLRAYLASAASQELRMFLADGAGAPSAPPAL